MSLFDADSKNEECEEGASDLDTEVDYIEEVQDEVFVVEKADAAVPHPKAVMVHSQSALLTEFTVFRTGWHDLLTCFTECELAHLGQAFDGRVNIAAILGLVGRSWLQFKQFHVCLNRTGEFCKGGVGSAGYVFRDRLIQALEQVLAPVGIAT